MSVLWLNSALAGLLGLAVVPLLAHLFARAKPKVVRFSSLKWLREVERRTARLQRPKDWLLLLLRTLAIAALALAFLLPVAFHGPRAAAAGDEKTVVLVVDRSASMGWTEKGQSRLARAAAVAGEILAAAGARTRANVIWLDGQPGAVFAAPGVNLRALENAVMQAQVRPEAGDTASALRLAVEQAGLGQGARELYLISDFQATGWDDVELAVPPNMRVFKLKVAEEEAGNVSVASVTVDPAHPVAGVEVRVIARLKNDSGTTRSATAFLEFGEARDSRPVEIAEWSETTVSFRLPGAQAGILPVSVSVAEDEFPADDKRSTVVKIREALKVGRAPEEADPPALWQRAFEAFAWTRWTGAAVKGETDVVTALPVRGGHVRDAVRAADEGAVVLLGPDAGWTADDLDLISIHDAGAGAATARQETRKRPGEGWKLRLADEESEVWRVFGQGEFGDPAAGGFWRRFALPKLGESWTLLMNYDDDVPALAMKKQGRGAMILWNLELDSEHSDWVGMGAFLPLLGELLLGTASAGDATVREFPPSSRLRLTASALENAAIGQAGVDALRLLDDDGAQVPVEVGGADEGWQSTGTLGPGSYRWMAGGAVVERAVIGFPASESDLRTLDTELVTAGETLPETAGYALSGQRDGLPLWPWLLGFCVALLMAETWLVRQPQRGQAPTESPAPQVKAANPEPGRMAA